MRVGMRNAGRLKCQRAMQNASPAYFIIPPTETPSQRLSSHVVLNVIQFPTPLKGIFMTTENQQTSFKSNPALDELAPFIGEWNIEITNMSFDPNSSAIVRGRASFDWLEGGAFLIQHSEITHPDFPISTAV